MIVKYKKASVSLFVIDFVCLIAIWIINNPALNPLFFIVFIVLFVIGCRYVAVAKGYNGALGVLLGLTILLGLIILLILPDRAPNETPKL